MADESTPKPTRQTGRIGKYEVLGHIATGGMGVIYKARHVDLDRLVALKILPAEMASQQTMLVRFQREAKAAAQLCHENIVGIFDVGEANGTYYIALEFIEGTDLQDYIARNCRLDPEEALPIMIQAARALVHAHERGIVHRDIKPSNFLLVHKDDRLIVTLTDFGLAIRNENNAEFRITRDETTVGTVDYMSPEQARDSRSADIRSDIYSLGCTFFHMLAGLAPFGKGTLPERIIQHMKALPPDVRKVNKGVPGYLAAIINRMLAKKPDDRYQTPADLLYDLEHPDTVVVPGKRGPATGKFDRGTLRKNPLDPAQAIENMEIDSDSDESMPKQEFGNEVKTSSRAMQTAVEPAEDGIKEINEPPASHKRDEPPSPIEDEVPSTRSQTHIGNKKKPVKSSPIWMVATAGSVGVLGLVLIVALIFGGRTPPSKAKDPAKPPDPPPIVENFPNEKIEITPITQLPAPAWKMTVAPFELPIMDTHPDKADRAALGKEYHGPFTAFPEAPSDAKVLRMSRLASAGTDTYHTLAEAFAATKPHHFNVIEIHDNGPIFVPFLSPVKGRSILLRGGEGYRPLVVWDVPKKTSGSQSPPRPQNTPRSQTPFGNEGATFCSIAQGKLILDNLDFVMRWSDDAPATLFDLPDTDFHARECTFSIAGKSKGAFALVRRHRSKEKPTENRTTQTWLKRCYVRGVDMSLLRLQATSNAVFLEESLIVGYHHPLIDMHGRGDDALDLYCVRSTLVAGHILLRWQSQGGKGLSPPILCKILDSILSRDDTIAPPGDMIHLADGGEPRKMTWRAANSVYAGWKQLLSSGSKNIGGTDLEKWHDLWFYRAGDRVRPDTWPNSPPSGLEEQPAGAFLPAQLPPVEPLRLPPVAFAALTGEGSIGCVIGWLPPAPEAWLERTFEPRTVPIIPASDLDPPRIETAADGLYHGERLDVTKVADLGAYLNGKLQKNTPASRVVMHLAGAGPSQTSPLRVKGVRHLVLYFEPAKDPRDPLTLEANPTSSVNRSPLIEMTGGHLELIGARIRLSPVTLVPTIIQVQEGNLTLTRCRLQGPHTKSASGFNNLIAVANAGPIPTTLQLRDNVLVAGRLLIQMHDHVQLKARNNVFLALGDGVHMDVNSPSARMLHLLDHNTWAVSQTFFTVRTGPEFQAAKAVLLHANSNAFLHPFLDEADKSILVRGAEAFAAQGRWSWQGRFNVYDARLHAYYAAHEKSAGAKQTRLNWQAVWGQAGEQNPLLLAGPVAGKTITVEATTQAALMLQLDRLALPSDLRGDRNQNPPGADLFVLGIKKKG
jgi:eukaryotic-like serine/threonine-protein kinase